MRRLKIIVILLLLINTVTNVKADNNISKADTIRVSSKSTSEEYINEIISLKVDNKIKDETIKSLQSEIKEKNRSSNSYKLFFYIVLVLLFLLII
jgi:hypothetical protein